MANLFWSHLMKTDSILKYTPTQSLLQLSANRCLVSKTPCGCMFISYNIVYPYDIKNFNLRTQISPHCGGTALQELHIFQFQDGERRQVKRLKKCLKNGEKNGYIGLVYVGYQDIQLNYKNIITTEI